MNRTIAADISSIEKIGAVHRILEVVCRTTGLGFSAVARVTESQWIACAVRDEIQFGLKPGGELKIETTICDEVRRDGQCVVIDNVAQDEFYCGHSTPKMYGFQSYISVPIHLPDGRFFGTLCGIGLQPVRLNTPETIEMFRLFADLIGQHLDAQQRLEDNQAALLSERETAKLREQFIAVLGHDLRNPLGAIGAGVSVLRALPENTDNTDNATILDMVERSTARMEKLIGDVLDFARGRLGGGLNLHRVFDPDLQGSFQQVVAELQATSPQRTICTHFAIDHTLFCDSARLAQMLSNLLANALTHSPPDSHIWVRAQTSQTHLEVAVTNQGESIEPATMEQLFEPFARGAARPGEEGLGLGLYIAAEIARAHEGSLEVAATNGEICFTFKMPIKADLTY